MKALSIRQPWAGLILTGVKRVENRSWATAYRGPLLIHAGGTPARWTGHPLPADAPMGGIVGICDLVDVVRDHNDAFAEPGAWHWLIANARPLPFVAMPGKLKLFEVPDRPEWPQ